MNLTQLEDFLETQEIAFTSILKATKNLDPAELKRSLTNHHAQMVKIAGGRYPMNGIGSSASPSKPASANKRSFNSESTDEDGYTPAPRNVSSSASTPTKPKTPNNHKKTLGSSSNIRASSFNGRMQPAGASTLFKNKPSYSQSPSGFKTYDVIDLSSNEGSDSEFAEAKENSNFEGSEDESGKKVVVRKGVATRKVTPAKKSSFAAKKFLATLSDKNDEEIGGFGKKKGEGSGIQNGEKSGTKNPTATAAVEIEGGVQSVKTDISDLEKSLAEKQAELSRITNVMARMPVLETVRTLKQLIQTKKALLTKDGKSLRSEKSECSGGFGKPTGTNKSKAATVEDASESDPDTLFKSQTPTRDSASKRRRI